jgi:hypothetical protein
MALTAEQMHEECLKIAEHLAAIIIAGLDKELSVTEKVSTLLSSGLSTFGAIGEGLDDNANPVRVALEVSGHTSCLLASSLLPLESGD